MRIAKLLNSTKVEDSILKVLKHDQKFCATFGPKFSVAKSISEYEEFHGVTKVNQQFVIRASNGKEAFCSSEIQLPNRIRVYHIKSVHIRNLESNDNWECLNDQECSPIDVLFKIK
jgi:hypothetical protein